MPQFADLKFFVGIAVVGIVCTVAGVALGGGVSAEELQKQIVNACEENRDPVRTYFADQLADQRRHGVDYYEDRFPGFTRTELRRLIARSRARLEAVVDVYDPSKCAVQYTD